MYEGLLKVFNLFYFAKIYISKPECQKNDLKGHAGPKTIQYPQHNCKLSQKPFNTSQSIVILFS